MIIMCTRIELDQILKKITDLYYYIYGNDICNICLYGSYARGESDIDIVAIVKGERKELQERLKKVGMLLMILDWITRLLFPRQSYPIKSLRIIRTYFPIIGISCRKEWF